jgi:hypothetical protein
LAEITSLLFVPMAAALILAHHGTCQFERRGIKATLVRQFLFGSALLVLLFFDGLSSALRLAGNVPPLAWIIAVCVYLVYLCLVVSAFQPEWLEEV